MTMPECDSFRLLGQPFAEEIELKVGPGPQVTNLSNAGTLDHASRPYPQPCTESPCNLLAARDFSVDLTLMHWLPA